MKVKEILKVTKGKMLFGNEELEVENFSKDTRTIQKGDIYIGIKGEKFDGNDGKIKKNKYIDNSIVLSINNCIMFNFDIY